MTNAELIKALRICANQTCCDNCPRYDIDHTQDAQRCCIQLINDAADALEADEKRIAELEAQLPEEGEWIEKWRFKTDGTPFHKIGDMECSVCHGDMLGRFYSKYCPHCGALLRGENDERTDKA